MCTSKHQQQPGKEPSRWCAAAVAAAAEGLDMVVGGPGKQLAAAVCRSLCPDMICIGVVGMQAGAIVGCWLCNRQGCTVMAL